MKLISYGAISNDFIVIAQLKNFLDKIKNKEIQQTRLDCYYLSITEKTREKIISKFVLSDLNTPENIEVFYPSLNYPSHVDSGGISYFVGLEEGNFVIDNVSYPIVPFVLYAFEDSIPHNSNFGAIMFK